MLCVFINIAKKIENYYILLKLKQLLFNYKAVVPQSWNILIKVYNIATLQTFKLIVNLLRTL